MRLVRVAGLRGDTRQVASLGRKPEKALQPKNASERPRRVADIVIEAAAESPLRDAEPFREVLDRGPRGPQVADRGTDERIGDRRTNEPLSHHVGEDGEPTACVRRLGHALSELVPVWPHLAEPGQAIEQLVGRHPERTACAGRPRQSAASLRRAMPRCQRGT